MYGRENLGDHTLVVGSSSNQSFHVNVTDGAGNPIAEIPLSNGASYSLPLGSEISSPFMVKEIELNTPLSEKGLILTADLPFYACVRVIADDQSASLNSKGAKLGSGKSFRIIHPYNNSGYAVGKTNVFSIMATEDNTTVQVSDINQGVVFRNTSTTGSPATSNDITITLNEGESYVIAAFLEDPLATSNTNGMVGTYVEADKKIVVNSGSWLGGNARLGLSPIGIPVNGRDIGIDQLIPYENLGQEYILMKGKGVDSERALIVAQENGTKIYLSGSPVPVATLNAGGQLLITDSQYSANNNLYIRSNKPICLGQTLNASNGVTDDFERQFDFIATPPITCFGAKKLIVPATSFLGANKLNIIGETGHPVFINGDELENPIAVPGNSSYVTYTISNVSDGDVVITSDGLVNATLINLSGNQGAAGYFTGTSYDIDMSLVFPNNVLEEENMVAEGCGKVEIHLIRGTEESVSPASFELSITGSAQAGIDYTNLPTQVFFAAGQTEIIFEVDIIYDGLNENDEWVKIELLSEHAICGDESEQFIIKNSNPLQASLADQWPDCPGEEVNLEPSVTGGAGTYAFAWSTGETSPAILIAPESTTSVSVEVTDLCLQESITLSSQINVPTSELSIITNDEISVLCPYTPVNLFSETAGGFGDTYYIWTNNGEEMGTGHALTTSVPTTSTYTVTATDQCGQSISSDVQITVETSIMQPELIEKQTICPYDSTLLEVNVTGGLPPFQYYWMHSGETTADIWVQPHFSTSYEVVIQDECGTYNMEAQTNVIVSKPEANFFLVSDELMENMPITIQNTSVNSEAWLWNFDDGSSSNKFSPQPTYTTTGWYDLTLVAFDSLGCTDTTSKSIFVQPEIWVYIPNSFTPDNDGYNQSFSVSTIGASEMEFTIYNRWGELIYHTNDPYFKWDGTYQNNPSPSGVYVYKCLVYDELGRPYNYEGTITLLR